MRLKIILLFIFLAMALPMTARLHEPITTKVMFNKEIIRIFERNCLGCHAPNKIKADIPLTTYEEARPWAKAIKEEILEKRMMPFQAVKGYGSFQHDYALLQRDVELIVSWVEGGAPRGDAKDYPKAAIERLIEGKEWKLGKPDLVLEPAAEVVLEAGAMETRCVSLPTGLKQGRTINAVEFQPGNGAIVEAASALMKATPSRFEVELDAALRCLSINTIVVANNRYSGHEGFSPRRAKLDAGVLAVYLASADGAGEFIARLKEFVDGTLEKSPDIALWTGRRCQVRRLDGAMECAVDGEPLDGVSKIEIELMPRALKVLAPVAVVGECRHAKATANAPLLTDWTASALTYP